jgi:uncharacterized membrane protein YkvA (DUF1232 family)
MATSKTKGAATPPGGPDEPAAIHDDFYRQLRAKITHWAERQDIDESYRDYVLLIPDLFHFLTRLVMEPRVETRDKAFLGLAVAYVLSPIDFIPDALFPIGLLDDLVVMVIVLDSVLGRVPRSLVRKHWAGSGDLFEVVREALARADGWVGKGLFRRLKSYLRKQGLWAAEGEEAGAAAPPPLPVEPATRPRTKTPSRRPAAKKASKTSKRKAAESTPGTASKPARKRTAAGGRTQSKYAKKRTVAGKKATAKKSGTATRTIAAKNNGPSSS